MRLGVTPIDDLIQDGYIDGGGLGN